MLSNPQYRAAVAQKQAAQARATALHEQGAPDAETFAAAQDDLAASTTIARIERAAAAGDPTLVNARAHLQAAAAERQGLQNGVRAQVMNDPDWQAAKQQLAP
ncbi:MAG TPA: hypothetical protein VFE47_15930 [Tepidisphaeraceae bacterium]|nr:hypothetical protein [Tepidisphaeraceae bacterium]